MDSALKQRLLGAAVLIALAVIFLPMFFSIKPPKQENTTLGLNIPPAPERNFETRNLAVDTPQGATPAPAVEAPSNPASSPAASGDKVTAVATGAPPTFEAPESATPKPATASPVIPKPAAATAPATPRAEPPPAPAVQTDGRFLVNLGVYADAGGANALVGRVRKLGYPAFAEATEYQGKPAQRVRVGPYSDRAAAESVRLKIKQAESKVPSSVVETVDSAKPAATEAAAPAPTLAANRPGGYAVQVGAFKSEEEANKLRDRLRNGGVAAFIDKAGDGEQALWKVRAGPYADRGGADAALASIKQKFQISGMIKTQP